MTGSTCGIAGVFTTALPDAIEIAVPTPTDSYGAASHWRARVSPSDMLVDIVNGKLGDDAVTDIKYGVVVFSPEADALVAEIEQQRFMRVGPRPLDDRSGRHRIHRGQSRTAGPHRTARLDDLVKLMVRSEVHAATVQSHQHAADHTRGVRGQCPML
jgi:hypothetical protein